MKNLLFIILLFAAGCVLPETRTTVVTKHIFSQEDTSFYFSDCEIKARSDSFELAWIAKSFRFFNAPSLSNKQENEIRVLYDRSFHQPYLICLKQNGLVTVSTIDTAHWDQYLTGWDTLHLSALQKRIIAVNNSISYYRFKDQQDSVKFVKQQNVGFFDSLYARYLRMETMFWPSQDTIVIIKTVLYNQDNLFSRMSSKLDQIRFWDMDTYYNSGASDGSGWTLEAKIDGKHHGVIKWNDTDNPLEHICKMLIQYANIPRKDIY